MLYVTAETTLIGQDQSEERALIIVMFYANVCCNAGYWNTYERFGLIVLLLCTPRRAKHSDRVRTWQRRQLHGQKRLI